MNGHEYHRQRHNNSRQAVDNIRQAVGQRGELALMANRQQHQRYRKQAGDQGSRYGKPYRTADSGPDIGIALTGGLPDYQPIAKRGQRHAKRKHAEQEKAGQNPITYASQTRSEEHTSELQSLMRISYSV